MTALATTFATGHVGLNVADLDRSTAFYTKVFGWTVKTRGDGYAFLGDDARLILTLWAQSDGGFSRRRRACTTSRSRSTRSRTCAPWRSGCARTGLRLYHDGIVPHSEGASSGGLFFEDPDGIRLEVFTGADVHGSAPSGAAPTCGFF